MIGIFNGYAYLTRTAMDNTANICCLEFEWTFPYIV